MPEIAQMPACDKFSWPRVGSLMTLMWANLRTTFYVFLAVGVATFLLILMLQGVAFSYFASLLPLLMLVAGLLFYIAPMFAVTAMPAQQLALVPASTAEKFVALCLYGFLILPAACYMLPQCVSTWLIYHNQFICPNLPNLAAIIHDLQSWKFLLSWLSIFLPGSVCLYTAIAHPDTRWRPAVMGVASVMLLGFIGGIIGALIGFRLGLSQVAAGHSRLDPEEVASRVLRLSLPWLAVMSIVSLILTVIFLRLAYRRLATRQL